MTQLSQGGQKMAGLFMKLMQQHGVMPGKAAQGGA